MTGRTYPGPADHQNATRPRIPDQRLAEYQTAVSALAPYTTAEVGALMGLLHAAHASTVAIGHGRHDTSRATASAIEDAWTSTGGIVLGIADWPAHAASWLRPARRLVAHQPDAWVIADTPAGCAQLAHRLATQPGWWPTRTFGSASLNRPELAELTGLELLNGMTGATADGGSWRLVHGLRLHAHPHNASR